MDIIGAAPALAVSVADFRTTVLFTEPDAEQDAVLSAYLSAAQAVVEAGTNRPLGLRQVRIHLDAVAGMARWHMPCAPVVSVESVAVEIEGVSAPVTTWRLERGADQPRIVFDVSESSAWSGAVLTIEATVGHVDGPVMDRLRQAVIAIAKSWWIANAAVEKSDYTKLSWGCRSLVKQVAYRRPGVID